MGQDPWFVHRQCPKKRSLRSFLGGSPSRCTARVVRVVAGLALGGMAILPWYQQQQQQQQHHYHPWPSFSIFPFWTTRHALQSDKDDSIWHWDHNTYYPRSIIRHGHDDDHPDVTHLSLDDPGNNDDDDNNDDMRALNHRLRNLLLVQTASNPNEEELVEWTSRPNRAYARQWGRDYVGVVDQRREQRRRRRPPPPPLPKVTDAQQQQQQQQKIRSRYSTYNFDPFKVQILHEILQHQLPRPSVIKQQAPTRHTPSSQEKDEVVSSLQYQPLPQSKKEHLYVYHNASLNAANVSPIHEGRRQSRRSYDAILLLPPDAIITDLDYDLLHLLPEDKLVAISGWLASFSPDAPMDESAENQVTAASESSDQRETTIDATPSSTWSTNNIIFFNVRHEYAYIVAQTLWDMAQQNVQRIPFPDDVSLFRQAIESVVWNLTQAKVMDKKTGETDQKEGRLYNEDTNAISVPWNSLVDDLIETDQGYVLSAVKVMGSGRNNDEGEKHERGQRHHVISKGVWKSLSTSSSLASDSSFNAGETAEDNIRATAALEETKRAIQRTADAVCYRNYPKCEVL